MNATGSIIDKKIWKIPSTHKYGHNFQGLQRLLVASGKLWSQIFSYTVGVFVISILDQTIGNHHIFCLLYLNSLIVNAAGTYRKVTTCQL